MVALINKSSLPIEPKDVKFEPSLDWLLIQPIEKTITSGGIALPDGAEVDPPRGKILKAGPGRFTELGQLIEHGFKSGDEVMLTFHGDHLSMTLHGRKMLIVRARDVLGKFTD